MIDRLKSASKAANNRDARWRHNSYLGHAQMMRSQCREIFCSTTATDEAKAIAVRIEQDAEMLSEALRTRKDQPT